MTGSELPPPTWLPVLPNDVRFRRMRGKMLLARQEKGVELDEVSSAIFAQIDGDTPVAAIADALVAEYDVDRDAALADVSQFLVELVYMGILDRSW